METLKIMKLAIMQPTYIPWCGYFALMDYVDKFILLDDVVFDTRSWQQRNKIKTANGELWLTIPVKKKNKSKQLLNNVEILNNEFTKKHLNSIKFNYSKTKYFSDYYPKLEEILNSENTLLCDLTIPIIEWIKETLSIETKIIRSSSIVGTAKKADYLVKICIENQANEYISPPGSKNYIQDTEAFKKNNITVKYFIYDHPKYKQQYGKFIPYLSFIDFLFNNGPNTKEIFKKISIQ